MIKNIMNTEIKYVNYGNKKGKNIILLHGWGQNIEMMKPLGEGLSKNYNITIIDLPGHGGSLEPTFDWSVFDYAKMLNIFIEEEKIDNPVLVGHSFGGKICLAYAITYSVDKIVLFGSSFKKEVEKLSYTTKILKKLKTIPILKNFESIAKKYIGSTDYKNASPTMRQILVNSVNLDLRKDLYKIQTETLLIWGEFDEAVSLESAHELETLIKNSALIVLNGATHYAYLERLNQNIKIIESFIEEE